MSIGDDLGKIDERIEEGKEERRRHIAENNKRSALAPNDDVIKNWNRKTKEITCLVENGCTETDEWCIKNSNWVEFKAGGFCGRSFNVSEIITEKRVGIYLTRHGVKVGKNEMKNLMDVISSLNAADSKTELKKYILRVKGRVNTHTSNVITASIIPVDLTPFTEKTNIITKVSFFSKVIKYIFGN